MNALIRRSWDFNEVDAYCLLNILRVTLGGGRFFVRNFLETTYPDFRFLDLALFSSLIFTLLNDSADPSSFVVDFPTALILLLSVTIEEDAIWRSSFSFIAEVSSVLSRYNLLCIACDPPLSHVFVLNGCPFFA